MDIHQTGRGTGIDNPLPVHIDIRDILADAKHRFLKHIAAGSVMLFHGVAKIPHCCGVDNPLMIKEDIGECCRYDIEHVLKLFP